MLQTQHDDNIEESDSDFEDEEEEDAIQASLVLQIVSRDSDGSANVKVNGCITPTPSRKSSIRKKTSSYDTSYHPMNNLERSSSFNVFNASPQQRGLAKSHSVSHVESNCHSDPHRHQQSQQSSQHELLVRQTSSVRRRPASSLGASLPILSVPEEEGQQQTFDLRASVSFLESVSTHAQALEFGVRDLRKELDRPETVLRVGPDNIVFSGIGHKTVESLAFIQRLVEETKGLKKSIDKVVSDSEYDISVTKVEGNSSVRRFVLCCAAAAVGAGVACAIKFPQEFNHLVPQLIDWYEGHLEKAKQKTIAHLGEILTATSITRGRFTLLITGMSNGG